MGAGRRGLHANGRDGCTAAACTAAEKGPLAGCLRRVTSLQHSLSRPSAAPLSACSLPVSLTCALKATHALPQIPLELASRAARPSLQSPSFFVSHLPVRCSIAGALGYPGGGGLFADPSHARCPALGMYIKFTLTRPLPLSFSDAFCLVFAVNSAIHSYLIVAYAEGDKARPSLCADVMHA